MRFLAYNPEQGYLLPPSVREVLGEDHVCFFLHRAVERLELGVFEQGYVEEGRPAYHPALLLKVWLYAYALGLTSARRLEQRVREDLAFRYLAGGATPDFWTLNQFRTRHARALNDLFTQWWNWRVRWEWADWGTWRWTRRGSQPTPRGIGWKRWPRCGPSGPRYAGRFGAGRNSVRPRRATKRRANN